MKPGSILLLIILLLSLCSSSFAQENKTPFAKEEILRLLKPVPGKRVEQGELAAEIAVRGIAFAVDEKTLDLFREAGARSFVLEAIKQAAATPTLQSSNRQTNTATPRPLSEEELKRLPLPHQASYRVATFLQELPNFVVTQTVSRSVRNADKKDWQVADRLTIELTYSHKNGDKQKLLKINDRATTQSFESVAGMTSFGEFGGYLSNLLSPYAQFKELQPESYRGQSTMTYEFRIKKEHSKNILTDKTSGRKVTTGLQGTVWVEMNTARVLRIELSAEDIPAGFLYTMAETAVEYDWVTIAGKKYFLPLTSEIIMGNEYTRIYDRNVTEFQNYRLFETDVKIVEDKDPPPKQ